MHDDSELAVGPRDQATVTVGFTEPDARQASGGLSSFRDAASSVKDLNSLVARMALCTYLSFASADFHR